jgi:hypothetical protein
MTELKNTRLPLLERIRSKSVIVCLFAGFSMSGGLSAQHSSGHTVTIRIVRPIQFSVETAANETTNDSHSKNDGMWLTWKSDSKPKRVTVSRTSGYSAEIVDLPMPNGNSTVSHNRMRLMAQETDRAAAGMKTAGRPAGPTDPASESRVVSADGKDKVFYTVCDI